MFFAATLIECNASVNLPLHHKVQKFSSGTGSSGWSRKKGRKTVVVCGVVHLYCIDTSSMNDPKFVETYQGGSQEHIFRPANTLNWFNRQQRSVQCIERGKIFILLQMDFSQNKPLKSRDSSSQNSCFFN